jgi:hypothetical protein
MSGKRQNNQLRLAFGEEGRSEAPTASGEGSETPTAKRMNESPAKNHEQLMEEVCDRENCLQAFKRVKSNKGSPSIDGMTVDDLSAYFKEHWPAIREQLLTGAYKPQPVMRVTPLLRISLPLDRRSGDGPSSPRVSKHLVPPKTSARTRICHGQFVARASSYLAGMQRNATGQCGGCPQGASCHMIPENT